MMRRLHPLGLILACLAPLATHAQLPKSLITQGAFDGTLDGWEVAFGKVDLDAQQAHAGPGAVRLTDAAALQTPLIPYAQQFLRVAFYMKTENIQRGKQPWNLAGAQVQWFDANQQERAHTDLGLTAGTTDWTPHEASYFREAKEGIAFFRVRLIVWDAQGTAWFDDVVVEETEPPEAFRKVPLLADVEDNVPRFWALPELQPLPGPLNVGTMEVNFTADRDFLLRPTDPNAPEVTRLDIRLNADEPLGYSEAGLEADAGYCYRYKTLAESASGYPALEVYSEVFRGSPILSQFIRLYLANESKVPRLEVAFDVPKGLDRLSYFTGNRLETSELGQVAPYYRFGETTKPFFILHDAADTTGLVLYHPIPAEIRRWHIEDYVVELRPVIVCRTLKQPDGSFRLSYEFRDIQAGPGGYEHSLDFHVFLMPYAGSLKTALREFQLSDADLAEDRPPWPGAGRDGYWTEWFDNPSRERILRMARYHPREFASWIPGAVGGCYGHGNGHMWGVMTLQMKGIRVDPLSDRALWRDHAFRMLRFFIERANHCGAPPDMSMWRELAARLPNPEDYFTHVFCQYWEYRVGEFRRLMQSPHLTADEKGQIYLALQRARNVFDPTSPTTWTRLTPNDGYWFDYINLPLWPENPWIINTHATSVVVAGEFWQLAREMNDAADVQWWGEVFRRGVDGLLYALGQDSMWYVDAHDPNELRYGKLQGGPRSYHTYMVSAWMPQIIRTAIALDNYQVDPLVDYYRRMMQAQFLQTDAATLKAANDFLQSIGRGG